MSSEPLCKVADCENEAAWICDAGWRYCTFHKEIGHTHPDVSDPRKTKKATFRRFKHEG